MEPLHAIVLTVSLFVLTFFNPGANLFVVVQTSLASGRRAGMMTGLGVTLGDAFYSGLGLFGLATLISQCETLFALIKIGGGGLSTLVRLEQCTLPSQATAAHPAAHTHGTLGEILPSRTLDRPVEPTDRLILYQYLLGDAQYRYPALGATRRLGRNRHRLPPLALIPQPGVLLTGGTAHLWANTACCLSPHRCHHRTLCTQIDL